MSFKSAVFFATVMDDKDEGHMWWETILYLLLENKRQSHIKRTVNEKRGGTGELQIS